MGGGGGGQDSVSLLALELVQLSCNYASCSICATALLKRSSNCSSHSTAHASCTTASPVDNHLPRPSQLTHVGREA